MGYLGRFSEGVETIQGVVAVVVAASWILYQMRTKKNLPPGPRPLPFIGNLHMLGKLPYRTLRALSEKYGPLMFLRLGSVPTVVASSPEMAREFLKTHDIVFANRPDTSGGKIMMYNNTNVAYAPYGSYWREIRKVCVLQLLSPKRLESCQFAREEEVSLMIQSILEEGVKKSNPVNVSKAVSALSTDIICRMAFGRKYSSEAFDNRGFKAVIQEYFFLMGTTNIGDVIPSLAWMDLQGIVRRQKNIHKILDDFFEKIIEEHSNVQNDVDHRDFVDVLLAVSKDNDMEIKLTRDNIKAIILDLLVAGTDTSSNVLEWAMSEVLKNPSLTKKLQEELERVVGHDRKLEECDLPRLQYLEAVVKETMRLHPPVPLLLPHESSESCTVSGYELPRKTRVLINAWAIARDPKLWDDAEIFKPDRFVGSSIDVRGQDLELIPFGSGRRGCPGMQLGITVVQLALAQLLHCFDWKLPDGMDGQDLDMTEEFGLTTPRASDLIAVPTPRFQLI
eukprot:Gb_16073 [translate_table: standard]